MTVYIDDPMTWMGQYNQWCHMWADDEDELHRMAIRIGLHVSWFQKRTNFPHYDLAPKKRTAALAAGAVYMPLRVWIASKKATA